MVIGDFNGFQFNDGYADIYNTILGNAPTPPTSGANDTVCGVGADGGVESADAPLVSLTGTAVNSANYSFLFDAVPRR
ncbi:hypothetical protein J8C07_07815 [Chloracidobacterium sp. S]|uniref:hypothetical protein n=1 Tax=Chloracidobacterium aggregatum TaxID=2851959 RepID=UPI001B8B0D69|nr:hypothetical protein [Chloracidobacterium aggregatum]QUV87099.1 hypothetical protein J8C07_07815 [Chloracidobacterium sp. S]